LGGSLLGAGVQRLGRDVGIVGPDDRAGLAIGSQPAEVADGAKRFEYRAEVDQV